jgi:hypothetical protein
MMIIDNINYFDSAAVSATAESSLSVQPLHPRNNVSKKINMLAPVYEPSYIAQLGIEINEY